MTTKPEGVRMWAGIGPIGQYLQIPFTESEADAVLAIMDYLEDDNWDRLAEMGYRCIRVTVTPVEG